MILKKLLKNTKFRSRVDTFCKENKEEIIDIILFGSIVKGKEKPRDIDILLLFKEKKDIDKAYSLRSCTQFHGYSSFTAIAGYKPCFQ